MTGRRFRVAIGGALCILAACATTRARVSRSIYDTGPHYVKLVALRTPEGEPAMLLDHPVDFVTGDLHDILDLVRVSEKRVGGWTAPVPAFGPAARAQLAPHLAQAFNEAGSTEYVAFKVTNRVPGFLLPRNEVTAGTMFVRGNELHIQLEYYGAPPDTVDRITYRPERVGMRGGFRLQPGEGMRRAAAPTGQPYDHWVAADWPGLQAKLAARRAARSRRDAARERRRRPDKSDGPGAWEGFEEEVEFPPEPSATDLPGSGSTEARLRELEALRQQGLITEDEYVRKRRAILDGL